MKYLNAVFAIFTGLQLCLSNPKIRSLAIWPWLVGAVCYVLSMVGAWYLHPELVEKLVSTPSGFFTWIWYSIVWVGAALAVLGGAVIVSVVFVMIFTSVFQSAIAAEVLRQNGHVLPAEEGGISGNFNEIVRTIMVETTKLIWIVPLLILVFAIGFIPFLLPFAMIVGAWLLAYQFTDVVLDLYKIPTFDRLKFALRHKLLLTSFGLGLAALWAIPFVGLVLPPAAAAGAAWLLSTTGTIKKDLP